MKPSRVLTDKCVSESVDENEQVNNDVQTRSETFSETAMVSFVSGRQGGRKEGGGGGGEPQRDKTWAALGEGDSAMTRRSVLTDHRDVQECRRVLLGKSR